MLAAVSATGALAFVLLTPFGLLGGGPLAASEQPGSPGSLGSHAAAYVVKPGDTLWSIATRVDRGGDPRPLVDRMAAQLGTYELQPGETIDLPG